MAAENMKGELDDTANVVVQISSDDNNASVGVQYFAIKVKTVYHFPPRFL